MANLRDFKNKNTVFTGTDSITIPIGTTAQRSGTELGQLRYNSDTGLAEFYTATGWAGVDAPPTVSSISGVINENTDSVITVTGTGFKAGAVVQIDGPAVSGVSRSLTTTYVNQTQLTAQTNATALNYIGNALFTVRVLNASGLTGELSNAGTVDRDPVWSTSAGNLATVLDEGDTYTNISLSASDPDGGTITYSIASGSLPGGYSLNSSTGVISSANPSNIASSTTYTFGINATSSVGSQSTVRSFNIIVNPAPDGSSSSRPGTNAAQIKSLTGTTTDGLYWVRHASLNSNTAFQIYCDMNKTQGGQWFSPGFFGVEPTSEYQLTNSVTYTKVKYRRVNAGSYYWWFLIVGKSGSNYTPIYGALIQTTSGGSAGDTLTCDLATDPVTTFGSRTIPGSGSYYIGWLSTAPGYTAPSGSIFNDTQGSRGAIEYVSTSTAPTTSTTYTTTSGATGYRIHIQALAVQSGTTFIRTGHPSWEGGWTLVHSNQSGNAVNWDNTNILAYNQTSPSLNSNGYSIISWAPTIRSQNSAYWYYMMEANSNTTRGNYGAIIHASTSDSFQDNTPRGGNYYRQETFPNSTFQAANASGDTCYDRVLWINQGSYSPHPSALLTTYPGTPNWWGTLTEGGSSRGYGTGPYMNSAGLGTPSYTWLWVK